MRFCQTLEKVMEDNPMCILPRKEQSAVLGSENWNNFTKERTYTLSLQRVSQDEKPCGKSVCIILKL